MGEHALIEGFQEPCLVSRASKQGCFSPSILFLLLLQFILLEKWRSCIPQVHFFMMHLPIHFYFWSYWAVLCWWCNPVQCKTIYMHVQDRDMVCTNRKGGQGHQGYVWLEIKRNCGLIFFWNCEYFSSGTCDLLPFVFISFEVLFFVKLKDLGVGVSKYTGVTFLCCLEDLSVCDHRSSWTRHGNCQQKWKFSWQWNLPFHRGKQLSLELGVQKKGSTVSTRNTCEAFRVINTWLLPVFYCLSCFFKLLRNPEQWHAL